MDCRVLDSTSPSEGLTLGDLWARMGPAERGIEWVDVERFPLLAKFIFTGEKLSIQVHPEDDYARAHEGEPWGKSEMWYVVDAAIGAWVGVGLDRKMDFEEFEKLLNEPEIEGALRRIPAKAGDVIYVPAGTLHTIGPGLILCEIQQYSDVTYRVYDYDRIGLDGRKRALHLKQALAVTRLSTPEAGRVALSPVSSNQESGQRLLACPFFVVEKHGGEKPFELSQDPSHFDLLIICSGKGRLSSARSEMQCQEGDAFLMPANVGAVGLEPEEPMELLRAYAPKGRTHP